MTLKKYAKLIQELAQKYPTVKVVYSRDEEGNGFDEVYYDPTPGHYDAVNREFDETGEINSVCIN